MGGGILDSLGLWFHCTLNILLCCDYKVALTSQMVFGHCKNHHSHSIAPNILEAFIAFCGKKEVFMKPEEVVLPKPRGPPVEGISDPVDGYCCTTERECPYSMKDCSSMQCHNREKHRSVVMSDICLRAAKVQTLFTAVGKVYFEVIPLAVSPQSGYGGLKATVNRVLPALNDILEESCPTSEDREPPPLIRAMAWDKFLPELHANRRMCNPVITLKDWHKENEHGGIFVRLQCTITTYGNLAASCLDGHLQKMTIAKVLIYGQAIPATGARGWRPISSANEKYSAFFLLFVYAIIRCHFQPPPGFSFSLSAVQKGQLEVLITTLNTPEEGPSQWNDNALHAYHGLLWLLISLDTGEQWSHPVQIFLWLNALCRDGNFKKAPDLTSDLTKMKYFICIASLLQAMVFGEGDGSPVMDHLTQLHDQVMHLSCPTAFTMVYEMQQYTSALAFSQKHDPNVLVDHDFKWITIGTETMHFVKLRDGLQRLLDAIPMAYLALTDINTSVSMLPKVVRDDMSNGSYLWVSDGKHMKADVFYALVKLWNKEAFDCAWGVRDLRQGVITMAWEFIAPDQSFACTDNILAESADHSIDVDHAHYGMTARTIPTLSPLEMANHKWVADQWHSFLGLGPHPPQEPQAIQEVLPSIVTAIIKELHQANSNSLALSPQKLTLSPPIGGIDLKELEGIPASLAANQPVPLTAAHKLDATLPSPSGPVCSFSASTGQTMLEGGKSPIMVHSTGTVSEIDSRPAIPPQRHKHVISPSCLEDDLSQAQLKRRKPSPLPAHSLSLSSTDEPEVVNFDLLEDMDHKVSTIRNDFSSPLPMATLPNEDGLQLHEDIQQVICGIYRDPSAMEQSSEQLEAIIEVINGDKDMLVVMRTGGGKSLLWTVPPILGVGSISLVVCPFWVLLDEQYKKCVAAGVHCINYAHSKDIPNDVWNVFIQVEYVSSDRFAQFLQSLLGKKVCRVFVDEYHDILHCHPDRAPQWCSLAYKFAACCAKIVLLSVTFPPQLVEKLIKLYNLVENDLAIIRGPTDRLEIGLHATQVEPKEAYNALHHLMFALINTLTDSEQMLLFLPSALYHSKLPASIREYNVAQWDRRETKVMACTSAFAQGIDQPNVKFVVIFELTYGMLLHMQEVEHVSYQREMVNMILSTGCKVHASMEALDGPALAYHCSKRPRRISYDACQKNSGIHQMALKAVDNPMHPFCCLNGQSTTSMPGQPKQPVPMVRPMTISRINLPKAVDCQQQTPQAGFPGIQDGDDLYGDSLQTIPSMEIALGIAEHLVEGTGSRKACKVSAGRSLSQPSMNWTEHTVPWFLLSQLNPAGSSTSRAERTLNARNSHLRCTSHLDHYMKVLKGCCLSHLVIMRKIALDHFPAPCNQDERIPWSEYNDFKCQFNFQPFIYCYQCGLPQSRDHNREEPSCHASYKYE
ncbi:hypothetical protein HD554DRAFT_2176321 [Boletus coccyginus]|nr:hypothetical protein HD554DRAFT_2176321 [Boletus coccyginus]